MRPGDGLAAGSVQKGLDLLSGPDLVFDDAHGTDVEALRRGLVSRTSRRVPSAVWTVPVSPTWPPDSVWNGLRFRISLSALRRARRCRRQSGQGRPDPAVKRLPGILTTDSGGGWSTALELSRRGEFVEAVADVCHRLVAAAAGAGAVELVGEQDRLTDCGVDPHAGAGSSDGLIWGIGPCRRMASSARSSPNPARLKRVLKVHECSRFTSAVRGRLCLPSWGGAIRGSRLTQRWLVASGCGTSPRWVSC